MLRSGTRRKREREGSRLMGRYILGLLFMSVIFSNGLLAYVWWSPDISAAGRWIMIFVPFFNVRSLLPTFNICWGHYSVDMLVWSHVDGDLDSIDWGCESSYTGVY